MLMVDRLAKRYGQHPDTILEADTYQFRLINTLDAFGLLHGIPVTDDGVPAFPAFDDDPTGLAALTETITDGR